MFSINHRGASRRFGALIRSLEVPKKMEIEGICLCAASRSLRDCEKCKAVLSSVCSICIVQGDGAVKSEVALYAPFDKANAFTGAAIKNKARVQICKEKS